MLHSTLQEVEGACGSNDDCCELLQAIRSLWGIWGVPNVHLCPCYGLAHCSCFCQLPNKQLGYLSILVPGPSSPPSYKKFSKLSQKLANFVHAMLAI